MRGSVLLPRLRHGDQHLHSVGGHLQVREGVRVPGFGAGEDGHVSDGNGGDS